MQELDEARRRHQGCWDTVGIVGSGDVRWKGSGEAGQEIGSRRGYLRGKRRHGHGSGANVWPQREERRRELRREESAADAEVAVTGCRVMGEGPWREAVLLGGEARRRPDAEGRGPSTEEPEQ